ncbi:tripartite tricarboxylate transporter substrate binding protein [Piscinibacter sakaiensis]|uniref:Putative exported protein n=1 Tax=Piscinibacter sakaiensis TaxID=1547922 RepID=A0A0K8P5P5_PISS1|nr:tripartite tricarboxylate transporter substrate binding protein [Piscinibacter sakaiensis]GAP37824.1 putative exported protein [Piscinibacter sakaiensis]
MKIKATLAGLATALVTATAGAQTFPDKPVRLVVAYPAGGGLDYVARVLADQLRVVWGQPIVVENKAGASGSIGADTVAKARPDGLTLLLASPAEVLVGPIAGQKTPYDPAKAFVPVSLAGETPLGIVAHPSTPGGSIAELLAVAKRSSQKLAYGTPGAGSSMHFAGEALSQASGVELTHIPYRGAAPAVNDLLGNQIPLGIVGLPPVVAHVKAGKLKLLAVTTAKRSPAFPQVPTVAEVPGLAQYRFSNWMLLMAPAGTPAAIVDKLGSDVAQVVQTPSVQAKLEDAGVAPSGLRGAELARFIADERERYSEVARTRSVRFSD